jgi:hypothetical protein
MRGKTPKERYAILLTSVQGRRGDPTVLDPQTHDLRRRQERRLTSL